MFLYVRFFGRVFEKTYLLLTKKSLITYPTDRGVRDVKNMRDILDTRTPCSVHNRWVPSPQSNKMRSVSVEKTIEGVVPRAPVP